MKGFLASLLALLLCASLGACGGSPDNNDSPQRFDEARNAKSGDSISLGMSRKDVEKQLGKGTLFDYKKYWEKVKAESPTEYENEGRSINDDPNHYTYGKAENFISIYYENDSVIGFGTTYEDATSSNWVLLGGITHGSPLEAVVQSLGKVEKWPAVGPLPDGRTVYFLNYLLDANGNPIETNFRATLNVMIFMVEETNTLLTFGVYTLDHSSEIDYLKSIFENRDSVHIFDESGNELTKEFFALHEKNYAQENWEPILDDLAERGLTVSQQGS